MTRISAGIRAKELCDAHLRKERLEILRIPNKIKSGKSKDFNIPERYRLGKGHEVFFRDKLKYLHNRYLELTKECVKRGFFTTNYEDAFRGLPNNLYNDWSETEESRKITKQRIVDRLEKMNPRELKYYGEQKDSTFLAKLII